MRVNYAKLKELNLEALVTSEMIGGARGVTVQGNGNEVRTGGSHVEQLSCYHIVHYGLEKFLNGEELTPSYKNLLMDLGILEETERRNIVEPFRMSMGNDRPQSN